MGSFSHIPGEAVGLAGGHAWLLWPVRYLEDSGPTAQLRHSVSVLPATLLAPVCLRLFLPFGCLKCGSSGVPGRQTSFTDLGEFFLNLVEGPAQLLSR